MKYFYSYEGRTQGPVSPNEIMQLILSDRLTTDSHVMNSKEPIWKKIRDIPELMDFLHRSDQVLPASEVTLEGLEEVAGGGPLFFHIPLSRLIFSSIISLGMYEFYWLYKNWEFLREHRERGTSRYFWRVAINPFSITDIFHKISIDKELNSAVRSGRDFSSYGWWWVIILIIASGLLIVVQLPGILGVLYNLVLLGASIWFLAQVQSYVNQANAKLERRYTPRTWGHYVIISLGGVIWLVELLFRAFL